jgi:hypothetical protein
VQQSAAATGAAAPETGGARARVAAYGDDHTGRPTHDWTCWEQGPY